MSTTMPQMRRRLMQPARAALAGILGLTALATALAGCRDAQGDQPIRTIYGAHPEQGKVAIREYGCGSCHMIPGVREAVGTVGPPLLTFGRRTYIAGEIANTPENLIHWIEVPQSIEPGTAMPNLGVTEDDARNIAAYLYTLR